MNCLSKNITTKEEQQDSYQAAAGKNARAKDQMTANKTGALPINVLPWLEQSYGNLKTCRAKRSRTKPWEANKILQERRVLNERSDNVMLLHMYLLLSKVH